MIENIKYKIQMLKMRINIFSFLYDICYLLFNTNFINYNKIRIKI